MSSTDHESERFRPHRRAPELLSAPQSAHGPSLCLSHPLKITGAQQNAAGTTSRKQTAWKGARSSAPQTLRLTARRSTDGGKRQQWKPKDARRCFPLSPTLPIIDRDDVFRIHFIFFCLWPVSILKTLVCLRLFCRCVKVCFYTCSRVCNLTTKKAQRK